ncbi:beta-lactamase hydrolase domain-containing protein [Chroococcus sp. FPU101]|uniref:fused DSP-PTPase phosphatase/NAD kinase-like protein n=1 Tax=Chroococcus sp. FPU101 TaxID=1974212 RepID=UPI001A905547|nr:sulfur transferase domain-containing protein [Chroococcus sp. FPU101]GFE71056.1 protein of unknown function DUF442 [Chroococcus sp. FPU101]
MTENFKKISEEFSSGGQPTSDNLQELAAEGFKSVVSLRSSDEKGVLSDEQQQAEELGLRYLNVPLNPNEADALLVEQVVSEIAELPTPIFFHCGVGGRAGALALISLATQEKLSRDEVLQKAQELGINLEQPHLKQFLTNLT